MSRLWAFSGWLPALLGFVAGAALFAAGMWIGT
jgi:hypothetical protein